MTTEKQPSELKVWRILRCSKIMSSCMLQHERRGKLNDYRESIRCAETPVWIVATFMSFDFRLKG